MVRDEIFDSFTKDRAGQSVMRALEDTLDKAVAENAPVVFMCRKAYWLYRVFRMYSGLWKEEYEQLTILSNRFIYKEDASEILNGNVVYVFDDTMNTGRSLFKAYIQLKETYPDMRELKMLVACTAVFPSEIRSYIGDDAQAEAFQRSLSVCDYVKAEDVGWLSSQEILMFQKMLLPYVIELPFLGSNSRVGDEKNPYVVSLPEQKFKELILVKENWRYVDNSYKWPNCLDETDDPEVTVNCGFFVFSDSFLPGILGKYAPHLIMKCAYRDAGNHKVECVFTPFAIMDSIKFADAWKMFQCLYEETAYLKKLRKQYTQAKKANNFSDMERLGVAVFRANVYFYSMYIYSQFNRMLSLTIGEELKLCTEYMSESFSAEFISYAELMSKWKPEQFLNKIMFLNKVSVLPGVNTFEKIVFHYLKNDIKGLSSKIRLEILRRKRENKDKTKAFISIEEFKSFVNDETEEFTEEKRTEYLIRMILQMTDQSVIGNSLQLRGDVIYRGYQYGENSDVVLPFGNPYIKFLTENLYDNCCFNLKDIGRDIYKTFMEIFPVLIWEFEAFVYEKGFQDVILQKDDEEGCIKYYGNKNFDTKSTLDNKRSIMKRLRNPIAEGIFKEWMRDFIDSWGIFNK